MWIQLLNRLMFASGLLFAYFLPKLWVVLELEGYHATVYNHSSGPCRLIREIRNGSEDLQMLPSGLVVISSGLRFGGNAQLDIYQGVPGEMFLFDFEDRKQEAKKFTILGDIDLDTFNPHGISLHNSKGKQYVYIINHVENDEQVNKFLVEEDKLTLTLVKTFRDPRTMILANNLVVIDDDVFYFTNYLYTASPWEMSLGLPWGAVVLFEHGKGKVVVQRLFIPNGINKSPDGRYIYLSSVGEQSIRIFERQGDNSLVDVQTYYIGTNPDNIDVDQETGDIITVGWPSKRALVEYEVSRGREKCPTQILRYKTKNGLITDMEQIYMNDGSEFSGGSVATLYKNKLLVGAIISHPMICTIL